MKCLRISAVIAVILGLTAPAWAQNNNGSFSPGVTQNSATGGAGGAGGNAAAAASATSTNVNLNTQVQGQQQGQYQGQGQGQSYQGEQSTSVNFEGTRFDRYAPSIAAPALTAAGTGACLGSFSGGLVGPMAGAMFGKTYESPKCENRMGSALLWQYAQTPGPKQQAFQNASLRVLSGESLKDAMIAEGILPAPKQAASNTEIRGIPQQVLSPTVPEAVTVSTAQLFSEPVASGHASSIEAN